MTLSSPPRLASARSAGKVLESALKNPRAPLTVADAAAASGLPLRDAETGLHWLTSEYRGHLRVTEEGQLLYLFPTGFTKPWETRDALEAAVARVGRFLGGALRFVVRAWLTIAILGYAALFLALIVGLTLARQGNSNSRDDGLPGGALGYVVVRVLGDALFWTFHPFSPLAVSGGWGGQSAWDRGDAWGARGQPRRAKDETPFYEKVNRFVFGPTPPKEDPLAMEKRIVAEIRAQKGRIGLGDVMRVTGLPREVADPMMARLMLDYEGDVSVSDDGGITYHFEALRKTASESSGREDRIGAEAPRVPAVWAEPKRLPLLTGNGTGSNLLIGLLNAFNLGMGAFVIANNLTIARILHIFASTRPHAIPVPMPYDGLPIALGLVPLVFSIALFVLPLGRALLRPIEARKVAEENGRRAMLREILTRIDQDAPLTEAPLRSAWKAAAGTEPGSKELTRAIVELGGDVDIQESGQVRYRFVDLETEAAALEAEREAAQESEAKVGKVVFGSDL